MKKILIVDDEIDVVEVVTVLLEHEGYEMLKAYDGQEALDVIEKVVPDLVILDIMMPKIDGVEVCRRMREKEGRKKQHKQTTKLSFFKKKFL